MRVVVIGAGVVGAAVAAALCRRGSQVTVLEARHPGAGTSGTTFGWVNSADKEPEPYFALNHAGVRAHHQLAGEGADWFFPTGNLEWAVDEEHRAPLAARVARLRARGYPAEQISPARARVLEPDLAGPKDADYAFFAGEGHALPAPLLARLLGEAADLGARVRYPAEVVELAKAAVCTSDGQQYPADLVVSCVGRWTQRVARLAGADVPMLDPEAAGSATVGFLASTAPLPVRLSRVLTTPALNVRPDGAGRLLLQALDLDDRADPAGPVASDGPVASAMLERLPSVLAGTEPAAVEHARVGQRAVPADGRTVAGFVGADTRCYVVATHSGITLAPLLGELVAGELSGIESALLAPFRPDRFASGTTFDAPRPAGLPGSQ